MLKILPLLVLLIIPFTISYSTEQDKFDPDLYNKVKSMIGGDISGASEKPKYYYLLFIISGDNDQDIKYNKEFLINLLNEIGAQDIKPASELSFVTANVPVDQILLLSTYDQIKMIGDGQSIVESDANKAKYTIKATNSHILAVHDTLLTGKGVNVAVIDDGINSVFLNDKVKKRIYCTGNNCNIVNGTFVGNITGLGNILLPQKISHGTMVSQFIAASGMSKYNGIAPNVNLFDAKANHYDNDIIPRYIRLVHSLDWSIKEGADIISHSSGSLTQCKGYTSKQAIMDEAVSKGVIIVQSAGNKYLYKSITGERCAQNIITIGGINDRYPKIMTSVFSSRGPAYDIPILKPDLVAPASYLPLLTNALTEKFIVAFGGTSFSTPMVSAVSALMLEADPTLTQNEVKNLLLLGANWTGPVPCTSNQYEQNNPNDNCSYARQPFDFSKNDLDILNNVGFGILNAQKSINYTLNSDTYMISSYLQDDTIPTRNYTIAIKDTSEPVKVIVNWLIHPKNKIANTIKPDLDFTVQCNDQTISGNSKYQTNEFVVFNPSSIGDCKVIVSSNNLDVINRQNFTISSTVPISIHKSIESIEYNTYQNMMINSTVPYDLRSMYLAIPLCDQKRYVIDKQISMTSDKDIILDFTTKKDFTGGKVFLIIKDGNNTTNYSLDPTFIENNDKRYNYTITIPNDIINTFEYLVVTPFFYKYSDIIKSNKVFSTSITGTNIYYQYMNDTNPIYVKLPNSINTVFTKSDFRNITDVYTVQNKRISLTDDIMCQFGVVSPRQIAKVFDLGITISNTTDGLEFTYKYGNNKYMRTSGEFVRELLPHGFNYIITDSKGNEITGNIDGNIKKKKPFNFIIPLTEPGNYDIVIYGYNTKNRILGTFTDSVTFGSISTIPPEDDNNDNNNEQQIEPIQNNTITPDTPIQHIHPIQSNNDTETNLSTPETPIQITIPESWEFDITDKTIDLYTYTNNVRIDTYYPDIGTKYYINDKADITMFRDTHIIKQYTPTEEDYYCYVGDLLVGQDNTISKSHSTTLQLSFRNADDPTRCDESPDIDLTGKLTLDKEIFVRFANTDNVPFYYDGTVNSIPKCSTNNFDSTANTLKNTEICYGTSGSDIVLVSKILTVFGI